jgi:hypothetical protein
LSGFSVTFDNANGGTYIANCSVTFDTPSAPGQVKQANDLHANHTATLTGIPLDATNMIIVVSFHAGDTFTFKWARPLATWLTGHQTIELSGVWPWGSHAKIRESAGVQMDSIRTAL